MKKNTKNSVPSAIQDTLIIQKLPGIFLILCLMVTFVALFYILMPFMAVLVLAAVLTIAFYPVYKRVLRLFRGREWLAALVSCLLVILVIVVPLTVFFILLGSEAISTYNVIYEKINSGVFDNYLQWNSGGFFFDLKEKISPIINLDQLDLKKEIINVASSLTEFLVNQTKTVLASIFNISFNFIVMLFAMYYFFKDGPKLVARVGAISPLPSFYEGELFKKIGAMMKAVVFGVFLTAMAQGVLGGIGFAIAGISNPVFWAAAMAFLSIVPMVGTAVVWFPAAIVLLILGNYGAAIFIIIWGVLLISSVDNLLRPFLIGGKAQTYPLLTFFVILGAVWTMGLKGVIVGPLVMMLLLSFLHIYESEYKKVLKKI